MIRSAIRRAAVVATAAVATLALAACATGASPKSPVRVGWSSDIPPLDPAASRSVSSFAVLSQLYPTLMSVEAGDALPVPDIAASAEWSADNVYTIVLKSALTFANGDALTTSDVKFSIERQLALQSEDGAWRQLGNLASVEIVDETTINFHLQTTADTRFPYVLAGPAGLVLDEEVFYADELTPDEEILEAEPFAGPYVLSNMKGGHLTLEPYTAYAGVRQAASPVELRPGEDAELATQIRDGSLDVITGRMEPETVETLAKASKVLLNRAASGRLRLLAFDVEHMPFGSRAEGADPKKAIAVRKALAELIDRDAIAQGLGANWVEPLSTYLPDGVPGAADVFTEAYGDGLGGPDLETATSLLKKAKVDVPVAFSIHVDLGQVGYPGSAEVAALEAQLEEGGLFDVTVVETDAAGLEMARLAAETQAIFTSQLSATTDPLDYLSAFRTLGILAPGFSESDVDELLGDLVTTVEPEDRAELLLEAQQKLAATLPAIPITQGVRVVFARSTILGVDLDDSFPLDLAALRR